MKQFDDTPEAVLAGWEGHLRRAYFYVALAFAGVALLPVLLGVAALFDFWVHVDPAGLCFGLALFPLAVALLYAWHYGGERKKLARLNTLSNPTLDAQFHVIRKQWQYVRRTSVGKRLVDILRSCIPLGIGFVIWSCLMVGMIWIIRQIPGEVPSLLIRRTVPAALFVFGYLLTYFYRDYVMNLHHRGSARGVRVIASDDRPFAPVLKHIRMRISRGPIWLVIEPPSSHLTADAGTHQAGWQDASHVIVMDSVDFMAGGPGLPSPEFVKRIQHPDIRYIAATEAVIGYLVDHVKPGEVIVILSIGDEVTMADTLLEQLRAS
jgi:hypothetical protein